MAEFFIELFSEEIPARMQRQGAETLGRLLKEALSPLNAELRSVFSTPRRIAASLSVDFSIPAQTLSERGPRESAPEKALGGFLRKFQATRDDLILENGFWVLNRSIPAKSAAEHIAACLPDVLWQFPWPKSQRWGAGSAFTWVRPLHRIVCLLDGQIVPFSLARENDTGHHLVSSNMTEGHRFLSEGAFPVSSCGQWEQTLAAHYVIVNADQRRDKLLAECEQLANEEGLIIAPDPGLVEEVTGLVEWPVAFLGEIDENFMDLPMEVMQVSMRVNQRYFTLLTKDNQPAPRFGFIANLLPTDGGDLTIAGNERVLRARFSDARYFWNLDRSTSLFSKLDRLKDITFHAKLGTQYERVTRIKALSAFLAHVLGADAEQAQRAALLSKIDLTTGMVGEFPELQGIMGGYYARHDKEEEAVATAISDHYMPRGPKDGVPHTPIAIILALADKIDTLTGFFAIDEKPSGSGDPFALRRAALGIIRIIRENDLNLSLTDILSFSLKQFPHALQNPTITEEVAEFLIERLRVQLKSENVPYDIMAAVIARPHRLDLLQITGRINSLIHFLEGEDGKNLLAGIKRASNILRIENKKDGPHTGTPEETLLQDSAEKELFALFTDILPQTTRAVQNEAYEQALGLIATLRPAVDRFFDHVTVNDDNADLRKNRLKLLAEFNHITQLIADFNHIGS